LARARWDRIPQGFRRRFAPDTPDADRSQLNPDLEALRTSVPVPERGVVQLRGSPRYAQTSIGQAEITEARATASKYSATDPGRTST
jgi:hypothetical protein